MPPALDSLGKAFDGRRRKILRKRFAAAKKQGELPVDLDVNALAIFFSGQALAVAVIARTGIGKKAIGHFIDVAMTALPFRTIPLP